MTDTLASYDADIIAWSQEQARLLRAGNFSALDIEHIADEVEDVGKSERRELVNHLALLLAHLLKWEVQPMRRGASWSATIREQRKESRRLIRLTPSLAPMLDDPEWIGAAWSNAVILAIKDTDLDAFPETCPWSLHDVLRDDWSPETPPTPIK